MPLVKIGNVGAIGVNRDLSMSRLELVVFGFCFAVGFVSVLGSFKHSDVDLLAINLYASSPFLPQFMPIDAHVAACAVALQLYVLVVFCVRAFSKIAPSIVRRVAVNMINTKLWEIPVYISKRKSVSKKFLIEHSDLNATRFQALPIGYTNKPLLSIHLPSEQSSVLAVVKRLSEKLNIYIVFHDQSPLVDARIEVHGNRYGDRLSGATLAMQGAF